MALPYTNSLKYDARPLMRHQLAALKLKSAIVRLYMRPLIEALEKSVNHLMFDSVKFHMNTCNKLASSIKFHDMKCASNEQAEKSMN